MGGLWSWPTPQGTDMVTEVMDARVPRYYLVNQGKQLMYQLWEKKRAEE